MPSDFVSMCWECKHKNNSSERCRKEKTHRGCDWRDDDRTRKDQQEKKAKMTSESSSKSPLHSRSTPGGGAAGHPEEGESRVFSSGSGGVLAEPRLGEGQEGSAATGVNTSGESSKKQAGRNEATDGGWRQLTPDEQCGGSWLVDKWVRVYWEDDDRSFLPRQPLLLSLQSLEPHAHCSISSAPLYEQLLRTLISLCPFTPAP